MSINGNSASQTVTGSLHPRVYTILIGLALWMALWVWSFVGGGETDYILFIVTGFIIVVVVALQLVLMRVRRADKTIDESNSAKDGAISFQQWGHRISDRRAWADVAGYRRRYPGERSFPGRASLNPGYNFTPPAA
jgi:hypothetical protein